MRTSPVTGLAGVRSKHTRHMGMGGGGVKAGRVGVDGVTQQLSSSVLV